MIRPRYPKKHCQLDFYVVLFCVCVWGGGGAGGGGGFFFVCVCVCVCVRCGAFFSSSFFWREVNRDMSGEWGEGERGGVGGLVTARIVTSCQPESAQR